MNHNDLMIFREVFDQELIKDGFIWRYQMYIHMDFEQYWYMVLWPKVYWIGSDFNLQYGLAFFHEENLIFLKKLHSFQWQNMFEKFDFFSPSQCVRDVSKESFQQVFDLYCSKVRSVLKAIKSPYDACLFQKRYVNPFSDQIDYQNGENMIRVLLMLQKKTEALEVIPLMRNRITFLMDFLNRYDQHTLKKESQDFVQVKANNDRYRNEYKRVSEEIDRLENTILKNQYGELIQETITLLKSNAETLKKAFTKKEISQMKMGW